MPRELAEQLSDLERWALAQKADSRRDALAYWSLKAPAILTSAGAGILARLESTDWGLVLGAVASLCVMIDGLNPRGMLRNTHVKAYHDIRMLTSNMMSNWRSRTVGENEDTVARRIVRDAEAERLRIAGYVRDAEAALESKSKT